MILSKTKLIVVSFVTAFNKAIESSFKYSRTRRDCEISMVSGPSCMGIQVEYEQERQLSQRDSTSADAVDLVVNYR